MRLGRLNITRGGIYWYTRRYTLAFNWGCRWHWKPDIFRTMNGGGWIVWGWWMMEKVAFDGDDDWGEGMAERQDAILEWLMLDELIDEKESELY
jgi:hypothetical protein